MPTLFLFSHAFSNAYVGGCSLPAIKICSYAAKLMPLKKKTMKSIQRV
jgi:hypothetical protein